MGNNSHIAWYVVITRWGQWKRISQRMAEFGVGCFIPPSYNTMVFLHSTKDRVLNLVNAGEVKGRFLIDQNTHTLLEVPEKQMEAFIRVTTQCPEAITGDVPIQKGTRVKVIRGSLKGVEGEVIESSTGTCLVVRVLSLLSAKVSISRDELTVVE